MERGCLHEATVLGSDLGINRELSSTHRTSFYLLFNK